MKVRILLALVFNTAIAFFIYWLGASAGIAWLTFLLFWMFAGLAEMSDTIWGIHRKLDTILEKLGKE
ncbi:MAG: hypothetical protein ABR881_14625 [Candidatus Sulfotelmatobacter sp.]|jgi:hypothetical protein